MLILLERKNFPLPYKILLAGLGIKLTSDRLTGGKKSLILCARRPSNKIDTQRNEQGMQLSYVLDKETEIYKELSGQRNLCLGASVSRVLNRIWAGVVI